MDKADISRCEQISPIVRRLLAPNPSLFTYTGTQTYIIGHGDVAVIDPGPDIPGHIDAILSALSGEHVIAILCTHTHRDHSPASRALKEATGAPIIGCAPFALEDEGPRADASFDFDYVPDRVLEDEEQLSGAGWTLEAVATPGHTSNHLCFALLEEKALFTGDHVMGWSTTIVSPPDGNMAAYMASLDKLMQRKDEIHYPAHGPAVTNPKKYLRGLVLHRRQREAQIMNELKSGRNRIAEIVPKLYWSVDKRLHPAAARSVLAHLIDLEERKLVTSHGDEWTLAQ